MLAFLNYDMHYPNSVAKLIVRCFACQRCCTFKCSPQFWRFVLCVVHLPQCRWIASDRTLVQWRLQWADSWAVLCSHELLRIPGEGQRNAETHRTVVWSTPLAAGARTTFFSPFICALRNCTTALQLSSCRHPQPAFPFALRCAYLPPGVGGVYLLFVNHLNASVRSKPRHRINPAGFSTCHSASRIAVDNLR